MPDNLYEIDALAWAEQQAELLRRLARGERLNETIDWVNVIEEVQDVGLSELRSCRSFLRQALIHLLKHYLEPQSAAAAHWAGEVAGFLVEARDRFSPSMRQRISVTELYAEALGRLRAEANGKRDPRLPATSPFTLDDLLANDPEIAALVGKVGAATDPRLA